MKRFYKIIDNDGFISGFGTNGNDETIEITEEEYNQLSAMFTDRPTPLKNFIYILRDSPREWVLVDDPN